MFWTVFLIIWTCIIYLFAQDSHPWFKSANPFHDRCLTQHEKQLRTDQVNHENMVKRKANWSWLFPRRNHHIHDALCVWCVLVPPSAMQPLDTSAVMCPYQTPLNRLNETSPWLQTGL